jgi:hypothetical protein
MEDQMSFFSHEGMPVIKDKGSLIRLPCYRLRINLIAGKLVSTRACFLFRLMEPK